MKRRWGLLLACVLLSGVAACTQDEPAAPTAQPTATEGEPTATPCAVEGATTEGKSSEGTPPHSSMIEVRPSDDDCPRVTFEFEGDQISGYKVAYVDPPITDCGSGAEVDTSAWGAEAFLEVRLEPSGGPDLSNDRGEPTYTGSRDITIEDGEILKRLKVSCDFEAVFTWVIGLDSERAFAVTTLDDPARLVVDISRA